MGILNFLSKKPAVEDVRLSEAMKAMKREHAALMKRQVQIEAELKAQALELTKHQLRFAKVDIVTETNVEFTADISCEVKTHQRHIAGIFRELAAIKGKL